MSDNQSNPPRMSIDEVIAAIGGPVQLPATPDGPSTVQPLTQLGLDKSQPEPFPAAVGAQQGAGSNGWLTPGAHGTASDGTVTAGNDDHYAGTQAPAAPLSGISRLTAGQVNTPSDGSPSTVPGATPGGPQLQLGDNQGAGLNPALKAALAPRPGPLGKPSL